MTLFAVAFLIGAAHQSRWAYGMAVILVLLIAATWDMVFKPGL